MKISDSRKIGILTLIMREFTNKIPLHDLVEAMVGSGPRFWADVLGDVPEVRVLYELVGEGIPEDEMFELFKPLLAERIQEELDAKLVKIEW